MRRLGALALALALAGCGLAVGSAPSGVQLLTEREKAPVTAGQDPLAASPAGLTSVFEGCIARLESAGLVKRLNWGDYVLLQPELLDAYAGAMVNAARYEPDGLGSILERRAKGAYERTDQRVLERSRATAREAVDRT